MTDILSNPRSQSHLGEFVVLCMATALMFVFMGLPSDGMYTFLFEHGLTTLDRNNYALLAGCNASFWLMPAISAYFHCSDRKLAFLDWPLWAKILIGLGFSSMWSVVLIFADTATFYFDSCCIWWM